MGSRTWIKIYCDPWLQGSLRQESPALRGIWTDLLALAGSGTYGDTGEIMLQNGIPLMTDQIAGILNVQPLDWLKYQGRLIELKCIAVNRGGIIKVVNWEKYQSEYSRQKGYRNKLHPKVTPQGDQEKEKEKEKRIERNKILKAFDEFWEKYPTRKGRKVGKKTTKTLFLKKISLTDLPALMEATENYAKSDDAVRGYAKDPERFIKNEIWHDFVGDPQPDNMRHAGIRAWLKRRK